MNKILWAFAVSLVFAQQTPAPVPFVGCKSDGQTGPLDAPRAPDKDVADVRVDPKMAARLALYGSEYGPAVLGPRGWHCFGRYGSSGSDVIVTPDVHKPSDPIAGAGIQASVFSGGTSGRFTVARIVARLFPSQRSFVDGVIAEGIVPASEFPSGPFPADHLTPRGDRAVEYDTPPRSEGLGTFSQLRPGPEAIHGIAVLTPEFDLRHLALRLPAGLKDLSPVIVQTFGRTVSSNPAK